jgi:protein transport protein SEC61 subunit gamma-like protein
MPVTENLKLFLQKCVRVWHILKKPDMREYKTIAKVSAIGILAIGLIGFAVAIIINLFR